MRSSYRRLEGDARPGVFLPIVLFAITVTAATFALEACGEELNDTREAPAGKVEASEADIPPDLPSTRSIEELRTRFGLTTSSEQGVAESLQEEAAYFELLKEFADTLDKIERSYVQEISREELIKAAIRGMLEELDPYSSFIEPENAATFQEELDLRFGGIGVRLAIQGGKLTVLTPLPDSPALEAGIRGGDRIVEIDGAPVRRLSLDEAVRRLQGAPGTEVAVTLAPLEPSDATRTVKLTRRIISIESVVGYRRSADGQWDFWCAPEDRLAYVRLVSFGPETAERLREVLEHLREEAAEGLILDLRFNPGGLFGSGIEVADLFLEEGVIVKTSGREQPKEVYRAEKAGTFSEIPLAVLIHRYSASASELVAASLQDHQRAIILGERSWGKGCVQKVVPLGDGAGALKLTTAQYLRPSGENLHRFPDAGRDDAWGVIPNADYRLRLTAEETRKLENLFNRREILRPENETEGSPESDAFTDPHLLMALEYFRAPRETGD